MSQETIKIKLDKVNSLFNVFLKEGIDKTSKLERDLLKIQLKSLISELDNLDELISEEKLIKEEPVINNPIENKITSEMTVEEHEDLMDEETSEVISEIENAEIVIEEEKIPLVETEKVEIKNAPILQFIAEDNEEDDEHYLESEGEKIFSTNKPTRNLKDIIDLNKSFVLRAELFANNNDEYKAFIDKLNAQESEKDSFKFVEKTAIEKAWDKEAKVYELLLRAVEKRFLPLI